MSNLCYLELFLVALESSQDSTRYSASRARSGNEVLTISCYNKYYLRQRFHTKKTILPVSCETWNTHARNIINLLIALSVLLLYFGDSRSLEIKKDNFATVQLTKKNSRIQRFRNSKIPDSNSIFYCLLHYCYCISSKRNLQDNTTSSFQFSRL